ncbi:MAG: tail fiber domain-containing protein [Ignavibacteriales bacterium]|nr:tail fiber domain-containing protein [Ignavibacteriales bacterium]
MEKNISAIPNALEKVNKLRGVNFEWKNPRHIGRVYKWDLLLKNQLI